MNLFLAILSVVALILFLVNQQVKYLRFKYINKLRIAYDRIEMYFVENDYPLTNNQIEFLKAIKYLAVNPEALDIDLMIASKLAAEREGTLNKDNRKFEKTLKSMPEDFMPLFREYDDHADTILKLSVLKPQSIYTVFKALIVGLILKGLIAIDNVKNDIRYAFANNEALAMRLSTSSPRG